jgi:aquaporin rerated protein, other eukaryote
MNVSTPGEHGITTDNSSDVGRRHETWANKLLQRAPIHARGHIVAVIGEFAGTIFFLFFAFAGTQVANISSNVNTGTTVVTTVAQKNPAQLLYISLSFGFSLAVNAWVFFRISGGLFNPAVSIQLTYKYGYRV